MAKAAATAKRGELNPYSNPTEVAMADAPAAWLEGMPPVPMNQRKLNRFSLNIPKRTLIIWAKTQTTKVIKRIRFEKISGKKECGYKPKMCIEIPYCVNIASFCHGNS
jgi:hypothetical protein